MTRRLEAHERRILLLKANGYTSAQIASEVGVTYYSITASLRRIHRDLGARSDTQAVAVALALGELGVHQIHIPANKGHRP